MTLFRLLSSVNLSAARLQAYYSQEVRRPRKNYTPGSSQSCGDKAQNRPYAIESQRLSELGLRLAWNLPSTFGESGSLRGPPARRIIKAKKRKTSAQGGADNEVCENFFRSSCGPAPVGGLHVCEKPRRKNRRRSSAECQ